MPLSIKKEQNIRQSPIVTNDYSMSKTQNSFNSMYAPSTMSILDSKLQSKDPQLAF